MLPRLPRTLWLTPLVVVACKQPPDLSEPLDEFASLNNEARTAMCMCPGDLGYGGQSECNEALGEVEADDIECMTSKFEGYEEDGEAYLACVNPVYADYVDCLEANAACEDGAIGDCDLARSGALEACPQLPATVHPGFWACTEG